jgi:2,3-bisphosphoglycerate-dependent phosphoglycerate mutase
MQQFFVANRLTFRGRWKMVQDKLRYIVVVAMVLSFVALLGAYEVQASKAGKTYSSASEPASAGDKVTTVFVVRHAEKAGSSGDVSLSEVGKDRAAKLAELLAEAEVTGIYTSKAKRTKETAQDLAQCLKLEHQEMPMPQNLESSIMEILRKHRGEAVLIVNHSRGVRAIINALGADGERCAVRGDEYDNLCVVTLHGTGKAHVTRLQYGTPSPETQPRCARIANLSQGR